MESNVRTTITPDRSREGSFPVAPETFVFDVERDFEILPPEVAENLASLVDGFDPRSYPEEWVPDDAPDALHRLASAAFYDRRDR